jgi:hypothetical protein
MAKGTRRIALLSAGVYVLMAVAASPPARAASANLLQLVRVINQYESSGASHTLHGRVDDSQNHTNCFLVGV